MQRAIVCVALTALMLAAGCESNAPVNQAPPQEVQEVAPPLASGTVTPVGPTVAVLYPEGTLHGFLVLKDSKGSTLANGYQVQTIDGSIVTTTMSFKFRDGSYFEEKASFSQDKVFSLQQYSLTAQGPVFKTEWRVDLDAVKGHYRVETHKKGENDPKVIEGNLILPADVYNGMISTIVKDLTKQPKTVVHYVAFTPKPRIVPLEMSIVGAEKVMLGESSQRGLHFVVKPKLGTLTGLGARLTGQFPPDSHVWITTEGSPGFVRADGPLVPQGPVWRVEFSVPHGSVDAK